MTKTNNQKMRQLRLHCNLGPRNLAPVVLCCVLANFVLRIPTNCYFATSNQNYEGRPINKLQNGIILLIFKI